MATPLVACDSPRMHLVEAGVHAATLLAGGAVSLAVARPGIAELLGTVELEGR